MKEKIKILFEKKYSFLLSIIVVSVLAITLYHTFSKRKERGEMWKDVSISEESNKPKKRLSNYEKIKLELSADPAKKSRLSQKAELTKKKKFKTSLVEAEEIEKENHNNSPTNLKRRQKKTSTHSKEKVESEGEWSYGFAHKEARQEEKLFKAIIREKQSVYDGTPVKIVLLESIRALSLSAGTTLKGTARLGASERIQISLTAAEGSRKKIDLICFDDDLQQGIYSDELAKVLAESAKDNITDEVADLIGNRLAQRALHMSRTAKANANLEEGKEIYVAIHKKEKLNNE